MKQWERVIENKTLKREGRQRRDENEKNDSEGNEKEEKWRRVECIKEGKQRGKGLGRKRGRNTVGKRMKDA